MFCLYCSVSVILFIQHRERPEQSAALGFDIVRSTLVSSLSRDQHRSSISLFSAVKIREKVAVF